MRVGIEVDIEHMISRTHWIKDLDRAKTNNDMMTGVLRGENVELLS